MQLIRLIILLILLGVTQASAQVALDAKGVTGSMSGLSPGNYTGITVGSGANRYLVINFNYGPQGAAPACNWDAGGTPQSMTLINSQNVSTVGTVASFGLVAPHSGNLTLQCTWTGTLSASELDAESYTGVNQSAPTANITQATSTGNFSITVTSASGDMAVANGGTTTTPSAGNQTVFNQNGSDIIGILTQCEGNGTVCTTASSSVNFTATNSGTWGSVGFALVQAGGAAAHNLTLLGVGQ